MNNVIFKTILINFNTFYLFLISFYTIQFKSFSIMYLELNWLLKLLIVLFVLLILTFFFLPYLQMYNTEVTVISLMDPPDMVIQHSKSTKWWIFITDFTAMFQQLFICTFYFFIPESNLVLPLKESVTKYSVTKLFIGLDGISE